MTEIHRSEIYIHAPRDRVFRFFVDADWLPRWLGVTAQLDPRPGGQFRFEVTRGEWCVGEYVHVDPPQKVAFTWGWENEVMNLPPGSSLVEVELAVEGEGTRLPLTHSGLPDQTVSLCTPMAGPAISIGSIGRRGASIRGSTRRRRAPKRPVDGWERNETRVRGRDRPSRRRGVRGGVGLLPQP